MPVVILITLGVNLEWTLIDSAYDEARTVCFIETGLL